MNNQQIVIPAALYPKIKQQYTRSYLYTPGCYLFPVYIPGADSELEKILFFGVKSWFFTRNTPKMFAPPSARRIFFKCAPLTWNPGSAPASRVVICSLYVYYTQDSFYYSQCLHLWFVYNTCMNFNFSNNVFEITTHILYCSRQCEEWKIYTWLENWHT